jgi:hypothetical protein
VSGWSDIVQVAAGLSHTVGLKADGTVVATGNNSSGQCNVSDWDLQPNYCGDGVVNDTEECERDSDCAQNEHCTACLCETNPIDNPTCGDGIVNGTEECEQNSDCAEGQTCTQCICQKGDNKCFMEEAMREDGQGGLTLLRKFRDTVLARSVAGKRYVQLYYQYSPELRAMIMAQENLRHEVRETIFVSLPLIAGFVTSTPVKISSTQKIKIKQCLELLRARADASLAHEIDGFRALLEKDQGLFKSLQK